MTQKELTLRSGAELALLALIWGASFLSIRIALDEVGPLWVVVHRVGWAAALLWAVAVVLRLPLPPSSAWPALIVMGLLNNAVPFTLMAWGQLHIASGLTAIFNAATAIWGLLIAALVFGDERLTPRRGFGVALAFGGVLVAIGPDALGDLDPAALAQLAVLAGTLSYALAGAWGRMHLGALPPVTAAAGMLTGAAMLVLPLALAVEGAPDLALAGRTWGAIAYYAGIATAGAYLLYYRVLAAAGAGNLLLVTLLIPPVAITLGAVVRDERIGPGALAGFALLATGLSIALRRPYRPTAPAAKPGS